MRKKNTDSWLFIFWSMPETGGNSLTHPLHAFPLKLAASVVKRDRDALDVDLPVSEKDCEPKLKSE